MDASPVNTWPSVCVMISLDDIKNYGMPMEWRTPAEERCLVYKIIMEPILITAANYGLMIIAYGQAVINERTIRWCDDSREALERVARAKEKEAAQSLMEHINSYEGKRSGFKGFRGYFHIKKVVPYNMSLFSNPELTFPILEAHKIKNLYLTQKRRYAMNDYRF